MYGALIEDRPYRAGYSHEEAIEIMKREGPGKLDADCFAALPKAAEALNQTPVPAQPSLVTPILPYSSRRLDPVQAAPSVSMAR
jgi:HD-GYP domain-containing protein (c-di-GMP phosphodiesterase class II)